MRIRLSSSEAFIAVSILGCILTSLYLEVNSPRTVLWRDFILYYLMSSVLVLLGMLYRFTGRSYRLGSVLIGTGFFTAFTIAGVKLNYLVSPVVGESVDILLAEVDSMFGFNWVEYVLQFQNWDAATWLLSILYQSSLFQLLFIILILGFSGCTRKLEDFFVIGVGSSLVSIGIWSFWPSFGPAILNVPSDIINEMDLIIDSGYVSHLRHVSDGLVLEIKAESMRGLIAFPSMHTVMALMALYFSWRSCFFKYFFALNIFMPFAIILHGGHHLIDLIGGIIVFCITLGVTNYIRDFTVRFVNKK